MYGPHRLVWSHALGPLDDLLAPSATAGWLALMILLTSRSRNSTHPSTGLRCISWTQNTRLEVLHTTC